MKTQLKILCLLTTAILIFSSLTTTGNFFVPTSGTASNQANPSNILIDSLLPDPRFNKAPTAELSGTSNEFSSAYHQGTEFNNIELDWTHIAGTQLNFTGVDPSGIMPDCADFIYTYQDFEWPYNQRPDAVQLLLNYSTILTGDFAPGAQEYNNLMFRVYVWSIDSSGNWIQLYVSNDAVYTDYYSLNTINLNYLEIADVFGGMISENGVQEDPTDTVRLAIGLAPTLRFQSFLGSEAWTFYNGEVSIRISYVDLFFRADIPQDPNFVWQPKYNETYGTTFGDVFPTSPNATYENNDECFGMKVGPDGSVYVTGNSFSSYDLYLTEGNIFRHQFLLKYDSQLNLVWDKTNDNMTRVRSMFLQGGNIYTTGFIERADSGRNLIVTKWSAAGEKLWQKEWGESFDQVGVAIGVLKNGSIYVVYSDYSMDRPYYQRNGIMKYDNNGNFISNVTSDYFYSLYDNSGDIILFDDYLLYQPNFGFGCRYYYNGTIRYGIMADVIVPDNEGGCYALSYNSPSFEEDTSNIVLSHYNSSDNVVWRTFYSRVWPNGWYYSLAPRAMVLTHDNKIQVLTQLTSDTYEYFLLTFDLEGNLLQNRSIGNERWPYYTATFFMDSGRNGLLYIAFPFYNMISSQADVCVQAYQVYNASSLFNLPITTVVIIASTITIIIAIGGILVHKRRH